MKTNRKEIEIGRLAAILFLAAAEAIAQDKEAAPRRRLVVVSIPDRKAALLEEDRVLKVYPVAVGAPGSPSPTGEFTIVNRIPKPTYYAPGVVIPPGKGNPLGTRWIGLSRKSYGIHGTSDPRSIGRRASHGCIRMRNRDVEELFEMVSIGDTVELHGDRDPQLAEIFGDRGAGSVGGQ